VIRRFGDDARVSASPQKRLVLVAEGVDDIRRLQRLLGDLGAPHMILDGNGSRGVQHTCRALGSGFDQPHLGVCDRDVMSDEEVEDLRRRVPGLFVLPSRCLENELLHPPLLTRALDMTGHEVSETEVRRVLREIADGQYEEVHATMVDHILHGRFRETLHREEGETPIGQVRRRYEASIESAQNRALAVSEVSIRVDNDLRRRWDGEHLALINGKIAFAQAAQCLAPGLRGSRGLESVVLRHAIDSPPPGIAALRSEIAALLR
jgi:hypothetical protein